MEKAGGGSRLMQMKAKFQQKQLAERELKIASLYEAQQARALGRVRHSPAGAASPPEPAANDTKQAPVVPVQPGKVRQMFEERRTKAGIDKSYPLQPINNSNNKQMAATRKPLTNGHTKPAPLTNGHTKPAPLTNGYKYSPAAKAKESITAQNGVRYNKSSKDISMHNGNTSHSKIKERTTKSNIVVSYVQKQNDVNHNHATDINANAHQKEKRSKKYDSRKSKSSPVIDRGRPFPAAHHSPSRRDKQDEADAAEHPPSYRLEDETFPEGMAPSASPTPRSPSPTAEPKRPPRRTPPKKVQSPPVPTRRQPSARRTDSPSPRHRKNTDIPENSKSRTLMNRSSSIHPSSTSTKLEVIPPATVSLGKKTSSPSTPSAAEAPGLPCSVCGRKFAPDRLAKHEEICKKAAAKKRKPFDALKHRLAGTEAEQFLGKIRHTKTNLQKSSTSNVKKPINNDWRQKHEEFINAIRAAKQVQQHLDAGGKLSDLPPPPPSENPDYVTCPHCGRRFNQAAAERHIPKCATYQFNKPKANQPQKKR